MAIGWLSVLSSVPWAQCISNAPKVVDGAKKLRNAVAKKSSLQKVSESNPQPFAASELQTLANLDARATAIEATVADLHSQMLASSELIKELAEQNTQLIQRIENNRVRLLWLSSAMCLAAIVALAGLFLAFSA
ncbi:MAG: hypothetical protein Q8M58_07400 [Anaerolineales bacterium]|nr:hypothetical protein [Anaerolineales bacterium]